MGLDLPADTGTNNLRAQIRSASASTPWRLRALVQCGLFQTGNDCGLVLQESSSGRLILFGLAQAGGNRNQPVVEVGRYSSPTSAPTVVYEGAAPAGAKGVWLEIADNGTTRQFSVSADGRAWRVIYTEARTSFLTPDYWGSGADAASSLAGPSMTLMQWEVQ
jgi:hypothetical protein